MWCLLAWSRPHFASPCQTVCRGSESSVAPGAADLPRVSQFHGFTVPAAVLLCYALVGYQHPPLVGWAVSVGSWLDHSIARWWGEEDKMGKFSVKRYGESGGDVGR